MGFKRNKQLAWRPLALILTDHCLCEIKARYPGGFHSSHVERLLENEALHEERKAERERDMTISGKPLD